MRIEYIFIKEKNDFCNSKEQFLNLLSSNTRITVSENVITVDKKEVSYTLEHESIQASKEDLFYLIIKSEVANASEQVVALETVDTVLRRINDIFQIFRINTIYDQVSMHYAMELYPEIVNVENQLRKIIYLFMLKNVGSKWTQKNVPTEMKNSIGKTLEKNNMENLQEDYLYYADFVVLGWFFFSKYPLNSDFQRLVAELKKVENQTKEKIEGLLDIYESRSNWERYFSDKIEIENLSGKWDELYKYRNQVAHSKRINKKDFQRAKTLINELKQAFDDCLSHMNEVKMTEEQSEAVENVAKNTIVASSPLFVRDGNNEGELFTVRNNSSWPRMENTAIFARKVNPVYGNISDTWVEQSLTANPLLSVVNPSGNLLADARITTEGLQGIQGSSILGQEIDQLVTAKSQFGDTTKVNLELLGAQSSSFSDHKISTLATVKTQAEDVVNASIGLSGSEMLLGKIADDRTRVNTELLHADANLYTVAGSDSEKSSVEKNTDACIENKVVK